MLACALAWEPALGCCWDQAEPAGWRQEHANPQCFIDWFQLISCVETKQTKFLVSWMLQEVSGLLAASSSFSADPALSVLPPGWQRKVFFELGSETKGSIC